MKASVETESEPTLVGQLTVKIFADGADLPGIAELARNPLISGFTTNPTLMRKAGVADYRSFARDVLQVIGGRPISFEVFADGFDAMERQAREIASWGDNVYVKIPITNTRGEPVTAVIHQLGQAGVKVNVTAMLRAEQVQHVAESLAACPRGYASVFAGRVADTGRDPLPIMVRALEALRPYPHLELIWASPRELLNIFHADQIGCHIITVTHDVLKKLPLVGKDLREYSLETVRMFFEDGQNAGYTL
jgi:transaldolase